MARNSIVKKSVDVAAQTVTFTFIGEAAKLVKDPIVIKATEMPPEMRKHAELHGYSQKFGDALAKRTEESLADAVENFKRTLAQTKAGNWVVQSASERAPRDYVVALVGFVARTDRKGADGRPIAPKKITIEQAQNLMDKLKPEQVKAFRRDPWVKAEVARIRAERLSAAKKDAPSVDLGF